MFASSLLLLTLVASVIADNNGYIKMDIRAEKDARPLTKRQSGSLEEPITLAINQTVYWLDMAIGTPPQHFSLQLDTGSSDLWVPLSSACAAKGGCPGGSFDNSSSSSYQVVAAGAFNIKYGDGTADGGDYFTDVVQVGSAIIPMGTMWMGLASTILDGDLATNDGHGLVGVGYEVDEVAHLQPEGLPLNQGLTIQQALVKGGEINREAYSLYLDDQESGTGSILFGGVDPTKYTGELVALPVIPSSARHAQTNYTDFLVALTGISIKDASGTRSLAPNNYAVPALLDSGTTGTTINLDILLALVDGLGAEYNGGELITLPCSVGSSNAELIYSFGGPGGPNISVPMSAIISEAPIDTYPDGDSACSLNVYPDINGLGTILGDSTMRSGYFVYDVANNQIAIAHAALNATSTSAITAIPTGTDIPGCSSTNTFTIETTYTITTYTIPAPTSGNPPSPTFALGSATGSATASFSAVSTPTGTSGAARQDVVGFGVVAVAGLAFLL